MAASLNEGILSPAYGRRYNRFQDFVDDLVAGKDLIPQANEWDLDAAANSLDIRFAGTKSELTATVKILRRHGFEPRNRPTTTDTSWASYWDHETGARIWFSFSSTQCRRVKIGTKVVEQDVFEVQCDDALEDFR